MAEQDVTLGARASDAIDAPVEIASGVSQGDQVVRLDLGVLKVGVDVQVVAENAGAAESTAEAKP